MTKRHQFNIEPRVLRQRQQSIRDLAIQIHELENELVHLLYDFDQSRSYIRFGYNSLRGYCTKGLRFSLTQSQRIVTRVRRLNDCRQLSVRE